MAEVIHPGTEIVQSADKYCVLEYDVEENHTCCLPLIPDKILSMEPDNEFAQQLDPVTVFSLIQEAHSRKVKTLLDFSCRTLADKVRTKISAVETKTFVESNINQEYGQSPVTKYCNRLRSHKRETFIDVLEVVGLGYSALTPRNNTHRTSEITKDLFGSMKENLEYDDAVNKFMESSNIEEMEKAIKRLCNLICEDGALAFPLCSNVVERLVQIFDYKEIPHYQYLAASILSSASYHDCNEVINKKAIPVLVKVINHSLNQVATLVVITLRRLACESSYHIPFIVSEGALEAAHEFVLNSTMGAFNVVRYLAMLLAAVCRAADLSRDKEELAITISQNLFRKKWYTSSTIHIKLACYALSYLSYGKPAAITNDVCETVVKFLSHDDEAVVASALGVVGNIVRWGHGYQIQCLTEQCRLLQCLGESVLCSELKKFRKEGCQIISNLAVRSKTSIQNEADLIESLCKLLEKDESDVKMEAAWAIFNGNYA